MKFAIPSSNHFLNKETVKWAAIWMIITGISNLFLIPNGFTYTKEPGTISLFFLSAVFFGIQNYGLMPKPILRNIPIRRILMIAAIAFVLYLISQLIKSLTPLSPESVKSVTEEKMQLPEFSFSFWISKFSEIIFQQTYILALVKTLQKLELKDEQVISTFTLFFTLIHIPLLMILSWSAFYFIIPSFFAGMIFSYLIVKNKDGIIYNYLIHLSFYVALGTYLRIKLM